MRNQFKGRHHAFDWYHGGRMVGVLFSYIHDLFFVRYCYIVHILQQCDFCMKFQRLLVWVSGTAMGIVFSLWHWHCTVLVHFCLGVALLLLVSLALAAVAKLINHAKLALWIVLWSKPPRIQNILMLQNQFLRCSKTLEAIFALYAPMVTYWFHMFHFWSILLHTAFQLVVCEMLIPHSHI